MKSKKMSQQGFTILELLIATTVLSVILIMVSVVMISIGALYQKGINQSRVQGSARSIIDDVSQHLEFSKEAPLTATPKSWGSIVVNAYCTGGTRYSYIIGHQIGSDVKHVLWRDKVNPTTCPEAPDLVGLDNPLGSGGEELIAPNSRLTVFPNDPASPIDTSSPYEIMVGVAYGETELLTAPSGTGVRCTNTNSRQFCASAYLGTSVLQRLSSGSN